MRKLNERFIKDLRNGELSCFLDMVKNNRDTLSLEVRRDCINIYYMGGSLLRIKQNKRSYSLKFDSHYCMNKGDDRNFALLSQMNPHDIKAYSDLLPLMMDEMRSWFEEFSKPERYYQHDLLVNNPEIVDIEYQIGHSMRLDMLYFANNTLYIVENKRGIGAIGGKAGMKKHYDDICTLLADPQIRKEIVDSVCHISQAKKELGLSNVVIHEADIKNIEILFILADYNPKSKTLDNERKKMSGIVPASILMTTGKQLKIDLTKKEDFLGEKA